MRRRDFIAGLGSAAAWPLAARAQQGERMRRIALLLYGSENDPRARASAAAIRDELSKLRWIEGRNVQIDLRFSGDADAIRANVDELVGLAPNVIVTETGPITHAAQLKTRTIPIVLVSVGDPVANGYVDSLSRPGGNTTGITNLFFSIAGKWVELLKDAAPRLEGVAYFYNGVFDMAGYWAAIEASAMKLAMRRRRILVKDAADIERAIDAFDAEPNWGLIVGPQSTVADRELIYRLAIQHRLPTITTTKYLISDGGLMSYGPNEDDLHRRAASYVDRILRGAKVSELPVEFPTKFQLVIKVSSARTIGISESFLLRADELID
jgi:putative ABC transport system substrate-binding protein